MLQPSDLYVLLGSVAHGRDDATLRELASYLELPDHSVVQRARRRAREAGLVSEDGRVQAAFLEELIVHAARYIAPGRLGPLTSGVPAAWASAPMADLIRSHGDDAPPVWPSADGDTRGQELKPLHPSAVRATARHPELAAILSIVDSIRAGDARVRSVAAEQLHDTLVSA